MNKYTAIIDAMEKQLDQDNERFFADMRANRPAHCPPVFIHYNGMTLEIPMELCDNEEAFRGSLKLFREALEGMDTDNTREEF